LIGLLFHLNASMPGQELDAETAFFHNGFEITIRQQLTSFMVLCSNASLPGSADLDFLPPFKGGAVLRFFLGRPHHEYFF
jgi:hypothetical protein